VPDTRAHRGPHPRDDEYFSLAALSELQTAVVHLSWLLSRGYADKSSLKLVGDRFGLAQRQRIAVMRSACSDEALIRRGRQRVEPAMLRGSEVAIDGFNLLTTIEAALSGGVILLGRDGCFRDMASMHGSYRKVQETQPAITSVGEYLADCGVAAATWFLDSPVSNSGRLKTMLLDIAGRQHWNWQVELVHDPDPLLAAADQIVISADSGILNRCRTWCNVARAIIERHIAEAHIIDLSREQISR